MFRRKAFFCKTLIWTLIGTLIETLIIFCNFLSQIFWPSSGIFVPKSSNGVAFIGYFGRFSAKYLEVTLKCKINV